MSRAILPRTQVRTTKQRARVGVPPDRGADQQAQQPAPDAAALGTPATGETGEITQDQHDATDQVTVRLLRADAQSALLEIRCSCGKLTVVRLYTSGSDESPSPADPKTTRSAEPRAEASPEVQGESRDEEANTT